MIRLCLEFFKIGLFAVGGGLATFPFLQDLGEKTGWYTSAELADMIAVSESTPGPIGVNMSTYVGYRTYGIVGGILATFFLILPSLIILMLIARALERFRENIYVDRAFTALRPATSGLILGAVQSVAAISLLNIPLYQSTGEFLTLFRPLPILLFILFFSLIRRFPKWHPVIFIGMGALVGIIFKL